MTGDLPSRLTARLAAVGLSAPEAVIADCLTYLALLRRWNERMNLTALPLGEPVPDSSLDKLIVEPLVASAHFPAGDITWVDLGSGGGSPAVPLRVVHRQGSLTLVEARERKCAFLREAARQLRLARTAVLAVRFEAFRPAILADLVTIRAVRVDSELIEVLARLLKEGGHLLSFGASVEDPSFEPLGTRSLPDGSMLRMFRRV